MLDKLNISFKELEFEPQQHTYNLNGKSLIPVSNIIKNFYEEFDVGTKSVEYAKRHGLIASEVAKAWNDNRDEAAAFGTSVHDFAERYFYNDKLQPSNNHEMAVISFWNSIPSHIIKLHAEMRVFNEYLRYAGTIDNLFYDTKRKGVIISDYKTNKDLYKNFMGKTMYPPFDHLLDMPFNHYQLQLSCYHLTLQEIDIPVLERWVIWLKSDGAFEKLYCDDYTIQIKNELLNNRHYVDR
jgi:hypothetical protein